MAMLMRLFLVSMLLLINACTTYVFEPVCRVVSANQSDTTYVPYDPAMCELDPGIKAKT